MKPEDEEWLRGEIAAIRWHAEQAQDTEALAIHAALDRLEHIDRDYCRVVQLRLCAVPFEQVATMLGLSAREAHRAWTIARAWLVATLRRGEDDDDALPAAVPV